MRLGLIAAVLGAALLVLNLFSQFWYVERSRAIPGEGSGFTEILGASQSRLLTQLEEKVKPKASHANVFVSDTYNIVLAKLEGGYTSPAILTFLTSNMYNLSLGKKKEIRFVPIGLDPHLIDIGEVVQAARDANFSHNVFRGSSFVLDRRGQNAPGDAELIRTGVNLSPFNHWTSDRPQGSDVDLVPLASQRNYLLFVPSSRGTPYYSGGRAHVSFYQPERDYFTTKSLMSAYGQFAIFEVLNPTATIRVAIDVSETLRNDGQSRLPHFIVQGQNVVTVIPKGSGSMRMLSPPLANCREQRRL